GLRSASFIITVLTRMRVRAGLPRSPAFVRHQGPQLHYVASSRRCRLFREHWPRGCRRRRRRRRRDHKRQPSVPAGRASRVSELSVTLDIDVTLKVLAERKHVAELRPDAEHLRLKASDMVA